MLDPYLFARYVDGRRGEVVGGVREFDCWGLAMAVREELLGLPPLPDAGVISRHRLRESAKSYRVYADLMPEGPPVPGALAAVMSGELCTHVGVVLELDGMLAVAEINPKSGFRWLRIADFERTYYRVKYHADRDLREQVCGRAG
ncbi:MAG: hypothetical protein CVV19_00840 [Gammaproteobacteria bacterium HGW-Gammaproteobacteria-9]|nr:MAG: hypothetical protein CVV19_00840 [Gammaproteobacteria bacterium HGW-Gammaproteobacteria-9]